MRIFLAGGSGLVGSRLTRHLSERGDQVVLLTRHPQETRKRLGNACEIVEGDPTETGDWTNSISDCDAIVNLTGENLFKRRWTDDFKAKLRDSRIQSTRNLAQALSRSSSTSGGTRKVLVNASAIGYYGPRGDESLTEDSAPGDDFLAKLCVDWEQEAQKAEEFGARAVMIRTGVVLDAKGGALPQMMTPFKWFVGGSVASGKQWMSWIHHEDLIRLYEFALHDDRATGPINATAPNPVTNDQFSQALAQRLGRPNLLRVPKFALQLALGEVAELATNSQRVLPAKAERLGYSFRFPHLDNALNDVLKEKETDKSKS